MRKFNVLTLFAVVFFAATLMNAQLATRTWVAGLGDDANPCSRSFPCKTFAGAISKTTAGGEISVVDPGSYGPVTITKAITIDGGAGQVAGVLPGSGVNGISVQAGSKDVVIIRNLRINGTGGAKNGVQFVSGKALHVEHCYIFGFSNAGIDIEPGGGGEVFVEDTISAENNFAGMFVQAGALTQVDVYRSRFVANGIHGLWASSNSNVSVTDSDASGNAGEGFLGLANAGTAELNLADSSANNNGIGVQAGGSGSQTATVRVTSVSLNNNGTGFSAQANGTIASFGNNYNSGSGTPTGGAGIGPE